MWKIIEPNDSGLPVIKLDNERAVKIQIYYGKGAGSDGMSRYEYNAYVEIFAMAKTALEASLHDSFDTSYANGRCDCPWCHKAYALLDNISLHKP